MSVAPPCIARSNSDCPIERPPLIATGLIICLPNSFAAIFPDSTSPPFDNPFARMFEALAAPVASPVTAKEATCPSACPT